MSIKMQEPLSVSDLMQSPEAKAILRRPLVEWNGIKVHLSPKEKSVWILLRHDKGNVIPYKILTDFMYESRKTRSKKDNQFKILRVIIHGIRKKLKANIVAIAKLGYVLDPEEG